MASFHPSDSLHRCLKPGWIKHCKSAAELQRAANSLASYPNTARLVLMTPAFSVLAQENRMIPGTVFLCNRQISLVDQALLWDSDKSSNPCLLVCHYPNHLISLGHSSLLVFDLFRLYAPRVRDTLSNHSTQPYLASLSLLASHQKTSIIFKRILPKLHAQPSRGDTRS